MRGCMASLASAALLAAWATSANAQAPASPPATDKPAAVVNGEAVREADIKPVIDAVIADRYKLHPPTDQDRREIRSEVLSMLIDDLLMRQFLAKSGVQVDPAEINKQLAEMEADLKKRTPPRTLQDFYRESGQTEAEVRATLTNMLRWVGYVKTRITEAEVHKYYDANKEFFDRVQVRASHIMLRLPPNAGDGERQAAMDKLLAWRADIVAGKLDFAEAAKKYSQCTSAPAGGDLGFFHRKALAEPLAQAAFALPVGGLSNVVQTEIGLHLVKVTDRRAGEPTTFDKIKDEVRDYYVDEVRQQLLAEQRKTAKIDVTP